MLKTGGLKNNIVLNRLHNSMSTVMVACKRVCIYCLFVCFFNNLLQIGMMLTHRT
jgi:hypothetical protein